MARKSRRLSAEEESLWARVVDMATPLGVAKPAAIFQSPAPIPQGPVAAPPGQFEIGAKAAARASISFDLAPAIGTPVGAAPLAMDRKAFRKLSRGKVKPEARIDLHGLTLAQAHLALIGFVLSSHAAGRRLVLVITGKGRGGGAGSGPIPERKGILRDQVPGWLAAPPCKAVVIQVAQAHQIHGGDGACYVYLRRKP